jgi:hypothetical protein
MDCRLNHFHKSPPARPTLEKINRDRDQLYFAGPSFPPMTSGSELYSGCLPLLTALKVWYARAVNFFLLLLYRGETSLFPWPDYRGSGNVRSLPGISCSMVLPCLSLLELRREVCRFTFDIWNGALG